MSELDWLDDEEERGLESATMENKTDNISRIKNITLEIAFHENMIAMHKSAIEKLRKEKKGDLFLLL